MLSTRTYQAKDIAEFLLSVTDEESNDVSNLKLQKLCFYAYGVLSAMRGTPLFSDRIEAWDHGPVVPSLYHAYKQHGATPIPPVDNFDIERIAAGDRVPLMDVYEYYAQFSPWRLRNMTHEDRPWIDAYHSQSRIISPEAMISHFVGELDQEYVAKIMA